MFSRAGAASLAFFPRGICKRLSFPCFPLAGELICPRSPGPGPLQPLPSPTPCATDLGPHPQGCPLGSLLCRTKDLVEELLTDTEAPPVVCLRAEIPGFYNVLPDNRKLMYEISKYIISKCKTGDIGFVTGMDELADSHERILGFKDAMAEAGYEVDEDKFFHGNYWITQGPEMADHFIKEDGSLPEAIICSNDYEAIALCNELDRKSVV